MTTKHPAGPDKDKARKFQPEKSTRRLKTAPEPAEANPSQALRWALFEPGSLSHSNILQLQRTVGNRAVGKLLAGIVQRQADKSPIKIENQTAREPAIQRRIVITPNAYAQGIGAQIDALTGDQIKEYLAIAVLDDLKFAIKESSFTLKKHAFEKT